MTQDIMIAPDANTALDLAQLLGILPQDTTHSVVIFKDGHRIKVPNEHAKKLIAGLKHAADSEAAKNSQ